MKQYDSHKNIPFLAGISRSIPEPPRKWTLANPQDMSQLVSYMHDRFVFWLDDDEFEWTVHFGSHRFVGVESIPSGTVAFTDAIPDEAVRELRLWKVDDQPEKSASSSTSWTVPVNDPLGVYILPKTGFPTEKIAVCKHNADARLIAATPQLLHALNDLMQSKQALDRAAELLKRLETI